MVEKFKDNTPEKDNNIPFAGISVTNKGSITTELSLGVTNAIIEDFSKNVLFSEISRRLDNPDFIMKGEINRFMGKSRLTKYAIISMCTYFGAATWFFGIPVRANETNIEIVISIYNSKGILIGTYSGICKDKKISSIYFNISYAIPSQTNQSFSDAISQIRDKIVKDISKYDEPEYKSSFIFLNSGNLHPFQKNIRSPLFFRL